MGRATFDPTGQGQTCQADLRRHFCRFRGFHSTETEFVDGVTGGLVQAHQRSRESATVRSITPPHHDSKPLAESGG